MAEEQQDSRPAARPRITEEGIRSLKILFDSKKWQKLPHASVLERDEEYEAIITVHSLERNQVQRQFVTWKLLGQQGARAHQGSSQRIEEIAKIRVGDPVALAAAMRNLQTCDENALQAHRQHCCEEGT